MVERLGKSIFVLGASDPSFAVNVVNRIEIDHLTLVAAQCSDLLLDHRRDINPVVWPIRGEIVYITHMVCGKPFTNLLWVVQTSSGTSNRIQGTDSNSAMIRMEFILMPGVKGENGVWSPGANHSHQITPELKRGDHLAVNVAIQEGHSLDSMRLSGATLFRFTDARQALWRHDWIITALLSSCDQEVMQIALLLSQQSYCSATEEFRVIGMSQYKENALSAGGQQDSRRQSHSLILPMDLVKTAQAES
jgi:hypothetical protein